MRSAISYQQPSTVSGEAQNKLGVLKHTAYGFVNADHFAARAILISPGVASSP